MRPYLRRLLILALVHHVLLWGCAVALMVMAAGSVEGRPKGIEDQLVPRLLMVLAQPGAAYGDFLGITRKYGDGGEYLVTVATSVLWGAVLAISPIWWKRALSTPRPL